MLLRLDAMVRVIVLAITAPTLCIAPVSFQEDAAGVQCWIRTERILDFIRFDAIALSTTSVSGMYRLQIVSRSVSGSSESNQSGRFSLPPGSEEVLSTVAFHTAANHAYTARLDIEWDKGTRTCTAP
jgi:hypothetical protein